MAYDASSPTDTDTSVNPTITTKQMRGTDVLTSAREHDYENNEGHIERREEQRVNDLSVKLEQITFSYGETQALKGVDLEVEKGEIHALLGPNGSGKTTLIDLIAAVRVPESGIRRINGIDPLVDRNKAMGGLRLVAQHTNYEPLLTVRETLRWMCGYAGATHAEIDAAIEAVGLVDKANDRVGSLSGGQQRRVDIAYGIAGSPNLVLLDEPTSGLDAEWRSSVWDAIRELAGEGTTVIITTHDIDEAEALSDRVTMLRSGRVVTTARTEVLVREAKRPTLISFGLDGAEMAPFETADVHNEDGTIQLRTTDPVETLREFLNWVDTSGAVVNEFAVRPPRLEDVYLSETITNKSIDES